MSSEIGVRLTEIQKFFPHDQKLWEQEPFRLDVLAGQKLTTEH